MATELDQLWESLGEIFTDKETKEKLMETKKSIVEEYISEIKKWNKKIKWNEKILENYLINSGTISDKFKDIFRWYYLSIVLKKKDIDKIKKVREKILSIKKTTTEEELSSLKSEIMDLKLTSSSSSQESDTSEDDSQETEWESSSETTKNGESTEGSAEVWEAKEVELKQRMQRLFPNWVPQTEKEMRKYITKIKVTICTPEWKTKKLTLHVHKKLANEISAIFKEMYDKKIPINPETTACFNRRKMRKWSKMSHHSYGSAIDVNRNVNGWVYWKTDSSSPYFNDQATVDIWKNHWFYWWWDWSKKANDPMHFTYMNA